LVDAEEHGLTVSLLDHRAMAQAAETQGMSGNGLVWQKVGKG